MQGFALDSNGDVVIQKNKIVMIKDKALTLQKIRTILSTNKNEWFLNTDEGINFSNIFVKNPDYDTIKGEIAAGLSQVDEDLLLKSFAYTLGKDRKLDVKFEASDGSEDIIYNSETVNLESDETAKPPKDYDGSELFAAMRMDIDGEVM